MNTAGWVSFTSINKFLGCADPFLIAYAHANSCTIVTHERGIGSMAQRTKVKILDVCDQFHIPYISRLTVFGKQAQS